MYFSTEKQCIMDQWIRWLHWGYQGLINLHLRSLWQHSNRNEWFRAKLLRCWWPIDNLLRGVRYDICVKTGLSVCLPVCLAVGSWITWWSKQLGGWKLWQYGLWNFQTGYTKLESFLHKNQHTQRKLLNYENWTNEEPQ